MEDENQNSSLLNKQIDDVTPRKISQPKINNTYIVYAILAAIFFTLTTIFRKEVTLQANYEVMFY